MTRNHPVRTNLTHPGNVELSGVIPREVRLTGAGIALTATAVVLGIGVITSAIVLFLAYTQSEDRRQLRAREKRGIDAQVVAVARSGDEGRRRLVSYRFEVDDRSHTGRTRLRERDRRPVAQGMRLSIEYMPSHPDESWIVGYEPGRFPIWPMLIIPTTLLVLTAVTARCVRRQWTLLSEGRVAQARVTAHKRLPVGEHRGYQVTSEFQDLSGARHTAQFDSQKTPPPIGTIVPIVYHRDNPNWSAVYPFRLVRPARVRIDQRSRR
jgi:hypothetical protein